jgi:DNA-binding transcriptional LysR family regulator
MRILDIDDLLLMTMMFNGLLPSESARKLGLTPPAISHRIRKLKDLFGEDIFGDERNRRIPTEKGKEIFSRCEKALNIIEGRE